MPRPTSVFSTDKGRRRHPSLTVWIIAAGVLLLLFWPAQAFSATPASFDLQAAIDTCPAGGTVTIPAGMITITSPIQLKSGITLQGAGIDQTILSLPAQTSPTGLLLGTGISNVAIRDLTLTSPAASGYVFAIWIGRYSGVTIERVKVTNCMYALKADTQGAGLTVRDFTALACGQVYISNLAGGLFENLDLEMVTQQLTNVTFHALYLEGNNHHLQFNSVKARGGSGWTIQLYTETQPSDDITFDGLDVQGWPIVIADSFSNVIIQNLTAVGQSGEGVIDLWSPDRVAIENFTASGGDSLIAVEGTPTNLTLGNGTYSGRTLIPNGAAITTLVMQNVTTGSTGTSTTTAAPATTTTQLATTPTVAPTPMATVGPTTTATGAPTATTPVGPTTTTTTQAPSTATVSPPQAPLTKVEAVYFSSPAANSRVSGEVNVGLQVASTVAISKVRLYVDDRLLGADYRAPFAFTWNAGFVAPGSTHTLTAVAYDQAGRSIGQAAIWVTVADELQAASVTRLASPAPASVFADIPAGSPYRGAVLSLAEAGVVCGFDDGTFRAVKTTTRAQAAKMVSGILGIADSQATATPFTDLGPMDAELYPQKYVAALVEVGAVEGTSPGIFSPYDSVTRAQLVAMIVRALRTLDPSALAKPPAGFVSAVGTFSLTYDDSLRVAEYNGLLTGLARYGASWDPGAPATRGEVAEMLRNLADLN